MKDSDRRQFRRRKIRTPILFGLVLVGLMAAALNSWRRPENPSKSGPVADLAQPELVETLRPQIVAFCGNCHGTPDPAAFPQAAWYEEVKKGYDFYFDSGRTDLVPPDFEQAVAWFRSQAPVEILIGRQSGDEKPSPLRFRLSPIVGGTAAQEQQPAVSFIKWGRLLSPDRRVLLWSDMRTGELRSVDPALAQPASELLGKVDHPAHLEPCDLDGDGRLDFVVAELGSFLPADHAEGKVLLFNRRGDHWQSSVLQAGLGRVADVQPGDFDGDGDVDLVVAEFGWRKTGRILFLENQGNAGAVPAFQLRMLDPRHGTIHVPPADLDGDGRLDFVALISQEHETVVAFLNDGAGGFRSEVIYSANEPAFGSSGIQLVDLDADGDLDVLYTNGDTFDSFYPKPYHSIRWLENTGRFPFRDHRLANLPGVHRALAGDLDGDGDLDLVACSLLPRTVLGHQNRKDLDSLVWLEQIGPGEFLRHSLERESCQHAALELGDFDGDGDIDLAVGNFSDGRGHPPLTVWWNLTVDVPHAREQ